MNDHYLLQPLQVGNKTLKHRIIMAPLTRIRATPESLTPNDMMKQYYTQRATEGGLLISEATFATPTSIASRHIPGIFTIEQAMAWKRIVDAVHEKGGLFSVQAWAQGRVSHVSYRNHPLAVAAGVNTGLSPSATTIKYRDVHYETGEFTAENHAIPMTLDDFARIKQDYLNSADLALNVAGFDFFELHGAHGYLIDQIFNDGTNQRDDQYGGSVEKRISFAKEVLTALTEKFPGQIAIRISPHSNNNAIFSVSDSNPHELYTEIFKMVATFGSKISYVLVTEPLWSKEYTGPVHQDPGLGKPLIAIEHLRTFRAINPTTPVFAAGGFSPNRAYAHFSGQRPGSERYDAVAFGRYFISNPDIVFRVLNKLPLTLYDRSTFYVFPTIQQTPTFKAFDMSTFGTGYIDYPTFEEQVKAALGDDATVQDAINDAEKMAHVIAFSQNMKYQLCSVDDIGVTTSSAERLSTSND